MSDKMQYPKFVWLISCIILALIVFYAPFQDLISKKIAIAGTSLEKENQEENGQKESINKIGGEVFSKKNLQNILEKHIAWLNTMGVEGEKADLSGANLIKASLSGANLSFANLSGAGLSVANLLKAKLIKADLSGANLSEASLSSANLSGANLSFANLSGAGLSGANLSEANLSGANLSGANLSFANLSGAGLSVAKLIKAKLIKADLSGANLSEAVLIQAVLIQAILFKAELFKADLSGANLSFANLSEANLRGANLSFADLSGADLSGANLNFANLSGANLSRANLSFADLSGADLSFANLSGVDLSGAQFEPDPKSIPEIKNIAYANNLASLKYFTNPNAITALYQEFKNRGQRKQEREITRAMKYSQIDIAWNSDNPFEWAEAAFNYVFFELTCQFGLKPGRPLLSLICLIPFFSIIYLFALKIRNPKAGIWLVFPKERILKTADNDRPFRLTAKFPARILKSEKSANILLKLSIWFRMLRVAFYFSLQSATSIGYREINVGNWISRLQGREYALKATGWVRTISGLQSLLSVYLLALWILTYFGRPFEPI